MLGQFNAGEIALAPVRFSAHTNRVAVSDGHTVCASVEFEREVPPEEASAVLASYQAPAVVQTLPSAPHCVIEVRAEPDRPQPRKDRNAGNGMTPGEGGVPPAPLLHLKLELVSGNLIAGAAGGAILNGELLVAQGWVK
jgi:aspartate-semialdehyde dehydrogenase